MKTTRRDFMKHSAAITGAMAMAAGMEAGIEAGAQNVANENLANDVGAAPAAAPGSLKTPESTRKGDMLYRTLGRTGAQVSLIGLGGFHIGKQDTEDESISIIHAAIDRGINFMDNSWDYNEGKSEVRMGKALATGGYRDKVFLMTKNDGRTKAEYNKQLDDSLARLQTDHIDLVQFHEIIRMEDPDRIFAPGGALEAAMDAKKAGKIRHIGFTGHKDPLIHLRMLDVAARHDFQFETVQMPINIMDAHFRSFTQHVLPRLVKEKIGVLGMKTFGDPFILNNALQTGAATPIQMLHFSMTMPTSVVVTGIDSMKILDQACEAVRTFKPMLRDEIAGLLGRTRLAAADGAYELFKTTPHFDSTAKNPQWLG